MTGNEPLEQLRAQAIRAIGRGKLSPEALAVMADVNVETLGRFLSGGPISTRAALRLSSVLGLFRALQIVSFENPQVEMAAP